MQEKIAEILEGLKDEAHIQPIIYALFEKSDPEEVKKTIDDLQRSLSSKSEEVKKNLSANHEHLFSCTDMVEQLRAFSAVSSAHVSKISGLSQKLLSEFSQDERQQQTGKVQSSALVYQVTPSLYINTILSWIGNTVTYNSELATKCFLLAMEHPIAQGFGGALKSTWVSLVSGLFKQVKVSLEGKGGLHTNIASTLFNVLLPSFQGGGCEWVSLPRSQVVLICSRVFGAQTVDANMMKLTNPAEFLYQLFSRVGESVQITPKSVDPLEFINLLSLLEKTQLYSINPLVQQEFETSQKLLKRVCDDMFNHGIELETDKEKLNQRVNSCFDHQDPDNPQTQSYLSIYSRYVSSMVDSLQLVTDSQFDFTFVRRFYEQRQHIERVEQQHGVPIESRISSVIKSRWADYCSHIVSSLESRVDFLAICESMPDEFRSKDSLRVGVKDNRGSKPHTERVNPSQLTSLEFLESIQQELDDCLKTLCKLANVTEANESSEIEGIQFEKEAKQKFADLIKEKTEELVGCIEDLRGNQELTQVLKYLIVAHVVLSSKGVIETLAPVDSHHLLSIWSAQAQEIVNSTSLEDLTTELEQLFERMKLSWADPIANSFLQRYSPAITTTYKDHDCVAIFSTSPWSWTPRTTSQSDLPLRLPSLVRLHLPATADLPPSLPRLPQPTNTSFDGFTHAELLAQLQP